MLPRQSKRRADGFRLGRKKTLRDDRREYCAERQLDKETATLVEERAVDASLPLCNSNSDFAATPPCLFWSTIEFDRNGWLRL
ncbi:MULTISPECIES: hypothetical protein [Bradyrhizobium]|uniref:hypothetical protein n=1 Tax=Bradyrhizobium TaxID=374 RepID=UPI001144CAC7|nr:MULTISPECIES: hypothetical protein [Bradyrhizobium]MCS3533349.1 hypothetical protein [Bradyrhizobium japonicum]MCS3990557.1 hypothetical protein [Bradyrhizobium japonicum]MCS4014629.1 hypothetical protein [Bradyrhizobium japonicum]MCS4210637.1 hypothetical protein [Bradyrhizobium japonicum]MDH6178445.1 hypothetical protein [Bradyrhizobium japonicum]